MLFKQIVAASLLALATGAGTANAVAYGQPAVNAGTSAAVPPVAPTGVPVAPTTPGAPATGAPATGAPAAGAGKEITVMVGNGGLTFAPNNITASVGDKVLFMWAPTTANHTVTQSTAANLCTRKDLTTSFASGSHAGAQNFSFTVMVNDTAPIWFFCAVPNHCTKGMYGVINGPPGFAFQVPNAPVSGGPATPSGTGTGTSTNGTASAPGVSAATLSRAPAATSALFAGVLAVIAYMM